MKPAHLVRIANRFAQHFRYLDRKFHSEINVIPIQTLTFLLLSGFLFVCLFVCLFFLFAFVAVVFVRHFNQIRNPFQQSTFRSFFCNNILMMPTFRNVFRLEIILPVDCALNTSNKLIHSDSSTTNSQPDGSS